jgi:hypothetical protein
LAERGDDGFDGQKQRPAVFGVFDEFGAAKIEAPCSIVIRIEASGSLLPRR